MLTTKSFPKSFETSLIHRMVWWARLKFISEKLAKALFLTLKSGKTQDPYQLQNQLF